MPVQILLQAVLLEPIGHFVGVPALAVQIGQIGVAGVAENPGSPVHQGQLHRVSGGLGPELLQPRLLRGDQLVPLLGVRDAFKAGGDLLQLPGLQKGFQLLDALLPAFALAVEIVAQQLALQLVFRRQVLDIIRLIALLPFRRYRSAEEIEAHDRTHVPEVPQRPFLIGSSRERLDLVRQVVFPEKLFHNGKDCAPGTAEAVVVQKEGPQRLLLIPGIVGGNGPALEFGQGHSAPPPGIDALLIEGGPLLRLQPGKGLVQPPAHERPLVRQAFFLLQVGKIARGIGGVVRAGGVFMLLQRLQLLLQGFQQFSHIASSFGQGPFLLSARIIQQGTYKIITKMGV